MSSQSAAVSTPAPPPVSTPLEGGDNYFTMVPKERVLLFDKEETPPWDASLPPVVPICESLISKNYAVLDGFIDDDEALGLKQEIAKLYGDGKMKDGEIGQGSAGTMGGVRKELRTDKVLWMEGDEPYVGKLLKRHIMRMDILTQKINMLMKAIAPEGESRGLYVWEGASRSKIMATCYPAGGSKYVAHYDNPNQNGRKLTTILYLNEQWRAPHGGSLRMKTQGKQVDIAPLFNRLLCFWSDRRCPHEVMPTAKGHDRFAITIWYLDAAERNRAELRTIDEQHEAHTE